MVQSVSANALTAVSLWSFSRRQLIAIGDTQGALQIFVVSNATCNKISSSKFTMTGYIPDNWIPQAKIFLCKKLDATYLGRLMCSKKEFSAPKWEMWKLCDCAA